MPTKLGFQLHDGSGSQAALNRLATMPPAALLVLDNIDLMNAAYDVLGAGPVYAYQRYGVGDVHAYIAQHGSIAAAVDQFIDDIEPLIRSLRWVYHVTFTADRISEDLAAFDALVIRLVAEQFGTRLCVGNFLTGTPAPQDWSKYKPALQAAARYNAIVGLQERYPIFPYVEYGHSANIADANSGTAHRLRNEIPYPQGITEAGELVGRYRHLRDYARQHKIPVRMLITKIGAGAVLTNWLNNFGSGLGDWLTLTNIWGQFGFSNAATHYFEDLRWMDQHVYTRDPEVIGTCVFAWNTVDFPKAEIGASSVLLDRLKSHIQSAQQDQPLGYDLYALNPPAQYTVTVTRLRYRELPTLNSKYLGGFDYGERFTATHYAFTDSMLWLKHSLGWSAYAPLLNGNPDYDDKYLDGQLITTPRQDSSVNNFVGTIAEVRQFMSAHQGRLFYISINPGNPPQGARQFRVTVIPVNQGRAIIDQLHPEAGDPLMTPGAKDALRKAGQL
jgi:hypothetical protein